MTKRRRGALWYSTWKLGSIDSSSDERSGPKFAPAGAPSHSAVQSVKTIFIAVMTYAERGWETTQRCSNVLMRWRGKGRDAGGVSEGCHANGGATATASSCIIGTTVNIPNITMVICAVISWVTAGKLWTSCYSFIKHTSCELLPHIGT